MLYKDDAANGAGNEQFKGRECQARRADIIIAAVIANLSKTPEG